MIVDDCRCRTGASAVTTTVSVAAPISSLGSSVSVSPAASVTSATLHVRNPDSSAFTEYLPTGSSLKAKRPPSSDTMRRSSLVARLVAVTVTPGRTPPLGSVTTPTMSTERACATAAPANAATRDTARSAWRTDTHVFCMCFLPTLMPAELTLTPSESHAAHHFATPKPNA